SATTTTGGREHSDACRKCLHLSPISAAPMQPLPSPLGPGSTTFRQESQAPAAWRSRVTLQKRDGRPEGLPSVLSPWYGLLITYTGEVHRWRTAGRRQHDVSPIGVGHPNRSRR